MDAVAECSPDVVPGRDLLVARGLTKHFGGVVAVDDVDFTVSDGQIFGIIGSNGAGKSTLLGMVSGSTRPTRGSVELLGSPISGRGSAHVARRGIGRAHQIPRPFRQMTVREHADLAARLHTSGRRERATVVDDVLERCALASRSERRARDLGLLDLKRLGVARAMAMQPKVLLLDEVAAGLVGKEVDEVINLIRSINGEGTTIVMVEHVQALIRELASRVLVLEWGRVLTEGTPAAVAADPAVIEAYLGRTADAAPPRQTAVASRPEPVLSIDALSVAYGKQPALTDCSISLGAGEIVAVVGANGAGKTTLSRALAGIVPIASGRLALNGEDITSMPAHQRARKGIALCHEGRRLFREQTVRDNLLIAARHADTPERSVDERIANVTELFPEIIPLLDRLAGTLSGGQQQMVAIGRALVLEPRVLVFDELSLGLAPIIVKRIFESLPALRDAGIGLLLIEQNVGEALSIADHVYVLDHGSIAFSGTAAEVHADDRLRSAYLGAAT